MSVSMVAPVVVNPLIASKKQFTMDLNGWFSSLDDLAQIRNGRADTTAPTSQLVETRSNASRLPIDPVPCWFLLLLPKINKTNPRKTQIAVDQSNEKTDLSTKLIAKPDHAQMQSNTALRTNTSNPSCRTINR